MHGVIVILILLYFFLRDFKRRQDNKESDKTYIVWEFQHLIKDVESAYYNKFGVWLKIRPVTKENIKQTKRIILKIKNDFDNPNGKAHHRNISFPEFGFYFNRINCSESILVICARSILKIFNKYSKNTQKVCKTY